MFLTNAIQVIDYTQPILTRDSNEGFKSYIAGSDLNDSSELAEMFALPHRPVDINVNNVAAFFTGPKQNHFIRHDGDDIYRSLLKDLGDFNPQVNIGGHAQDVLINKIEKEFHLLVQYVAKYSQMLLERYSKALEAYNFDEALIILNHIYDDDAHKCYKLPLIFQCAKSFLVRDLNIDKIIYYPVEGNREALCELINTLQNSPIHLNVLDFNNALFKFPIGNLLNTKNVNPQMPTFLLPSCLVDINLLLRTDYYTDAILADCLLSLGTSKGIVEKIKELLISNNFDAVIAGKMCLVGCTYAAMFSYANAHNSQVVGASSALLVDRFYKCAFNKPQNQEDVNWIRLIAKIYFGPLGMENRVFC